MDFTSAHAPGWPGIPARWTSSAKSAVGTALSESSSVWFSFSHGIFNEIYYPRVDQACVRDLGLIVTAGDDFCSEEKRDTQTQLRWVSDGVPAYRIANTCRQGRYRIEKTVLADPRRDVIVQKTRFVALQGASEDYRLFVLLSPHLGNQGAGNSAWVGEVKGMQMLLAQRDWFALALGCTAPFLDRSVGFAGASDGWRDLHDHRCLTRRYERAENGNVALVAELDHREEFILVVGFGNNVAEAGIRARATLQDGFDAIFEEYVERWQRWQEGLIDMEGERLPRGESLFRVSTAVVRCHEARHFPGGSIASLSIPWGFSKGDQDLGGYHLVWPRDLVEAAGGMLAAGGGAEARRVLCYLQATQEEDGHWPQNMWLDGSTYWSGIQMDETALPVLLVDLARREAALSEEDVGRFWPMVRQAASYLLLNGPVSPEDRWEEDPGYSPFTIAAQIAALLAAAELAEICGEPATARYLRETADVWYSSIDRWMYVSETDWARKYRVSGYYVRIAPPQEGDQGRFEKKIQIRNRAPDVEGSPAYHLVSPDSLALVRFGLRRPDDPRIVDTVKVIDALLRVDTPKGPLWHRYNGDGYGEHEDGAPFDGTGVGRGWPLLTGERAHFELSAGRKERAKELQRALASFAIEEGLIPEQIWDGPDMPERELFFGSPSGSAMPLVWAHAEYLKLLRSMRDGRVFDMPPQTVQRYLVDRVETTRWVWRFNHQVRSVPAGTLLRIETTTPAVIRWSADRWKSAAESSTSDTGLGIHAADLIPDEAAREVSFTFYWPRSGRWEGADFSVGIESR